MKTHIIIHVLPYEIDRFEHQMFELRKNSAYLDNTDEVVIDATLDVNGELTDWGIAEIHKNYFIDRFEKVKQVAQWANPIFDVNSDGKCLGIDDKRRESIKKYSSTCDNFIYLDNDMFYPNTTLKYMIEAAKLVKKKYYVISPQCTWLWDSSWDVLVNDHYKQFKNDLSYDQFEVFTKDYGEIAVTPMPIFKMGGGWFNLISSDLLAYVGVPDAFGPYGFDDTFLMDACRIMKGMGIDVQQYVVKNLVVTQSYKFELHDAYKDYIPFCVGRKKQFADNAAGSTTKKYKNLPNDVKLIEYKGRFNMEEKDLKILDNILNKKPYYENFPVDKYKYYLRPGSMPAPDVLTDLVNQFNPTLIIEIGSFIGFSAVTMGNALKANGKDFRIICVDMWLSGDDYGYVERGTEPPEECDYVDHGYPTLYFQFVRNVIENKLEKNIIPLVKTSRLGAVILRDKIKSKVKVESDVIYVDGSHDAFDVYYDCKEYWPLLKSGGVMFGDDWTWEGVKSGVMTFVEENNLKYNVHPNGVHWYVMK